jgi:hypothetical protein
VIRFLKYAAVVLILILVVGFVAVQFVSRTKLNATFEQAVAPLPIATGDAAAISRGDYLVNNLMGCANSECHRPDLGGGAVVDAPPMGRIYAPNLTGGRGSVTAG